MVRDAERLGHADRRRQPACLEGIGGVLPFVLDVQPVEAQVLAEAARVQERRHPFAEGHGRGRGHDFFVAPHRRDARVQRVAGERAARLREVVAGEKRAAITPDTGSGDSRSPASGHNRAGSIRGG